MITMSFPIDDIDELRKTGQAFHNALVGSPGYVNDEICLCVDETNREIILVVGNNSNDKSIIINDFTEV